MEKLPKGLKVCWRSWDVESGGSQEAHEFEITAHRMLIDLEKGGLGRRLETSPEISQPARSMATAVYTQQAIPWSADTLHPACAFHT